VGRPDGGPDRTPRALVVAAGPQAERGAAIFQAICSKCHGAQGQGGDGPRLIGSPNGLAEYLTVPKLYAFIKTNMPVDNPNSLKDEEYWDVLAFVLDGNGLLPPDVALGPDTADNVNLTP
jgi:cytochrome c